MSVFDDFHHGGEVNNLIRNELCDLPTQLMEIREATYSYFYSADYFDAGSYISWAGCWQVNSPQRCYKPRFSNDLHTPLNTSN